MKLEFLAWIAAHPRTYAEAMEAWRSNCPRHPAWDDALTEGLIQVGASDTLDHAPVTLTERGRALLEEGVLAAKLLETRHLSVPERTLLPAGGVRLSTMIAAVGTVLTGSSDGSTWFPRDERPDTLLAGMVIERRHDGTHWLHEPHTTARRASSLEEAVHEYVRAMAGGDAASTIDGIAIDWDA